MDTRHGIWSKLNPVGIGGSVEAFITPLNSINVSDFVVVPETHDNFSDDYIQARAKTSTGDDACLDVIRIVIDMFSWASLKKFDRTGHSFQASMIF